MLSIGIHLNHVRVAETGRGAKTGDHRGALPAIRLVTQQCDFRQSAQPFQLARAHRAAAIVDQDHRQTLREQRVHHATDGMFVVVDRNHHADGELAGGLARGLSRR
jgi:hypothetical protein